MDTEYLNKLRETIEGLDKVHHVEIASIFKKNRIHLNENSNGIFINLNEVSEHIIKEIQEYIEFVKKQEIYINQHEQTKNDLEKNYFMNNTEDNDNDNDNDNLKKNNLKEDKDNSISINQ